MKKIIDAYASSVINYGLTDNMEMMINNLIIELKSKFKSIKENKQKLFLLEYLSSKLKENNEVYGKEREAILDYLKSYDGDYLDLVESIKKLCGANFYYINNDDELIKTLRVEVIGLEEELEYTYAENYYDKNNGTSIYYIPILNQTNRVDYDNEFMNLIKYDIESNYGKLIKLNNILLELNATEKRINELNDILNRELKIINWNGFTAYDEAQIKENEIASAELGKLKYKYDVLSKKYKDLKYIIIEYLDKYPELKDKVINKLNAEKVSIKAIIPVVFELYKSYLLPKLLNDATTLLEQRNKESKEYCQELLSKLDNTILDLKASIKKDEEYFNDIFILNVLDCIYFGLKDETLCSLNTSNSINSIINTIEQVIYLDDTEKVLVK